MRSRNACAETVLAGWLCLGVGLALAGPCEPPPSPPSGLAVHDGFMEFIPPHELRPFKDALPHVAKKEVDDLLRSPQTLWYDEASMVFIYQDSIEVVVGARANCVGRQIGENNASNPAIGKLLKFFGPDFRFLFPFRTAAGTDNVTNVKVLNFWSPPRKADKVLPVRYWRPSSRGRWYWTFPFGTVFGEVLYQKGPGGQWYVFEIRTRKRYRDGWAVDVFRPFRTAAAFADAIIRKRPDWHFDPELRKLIYHLWDNTTLVANRWESKAYGKVFPPIDGALDPLPEIQDPQVIADLLRETLFVSMEGAIWKESGTLQTYGPGSQAEFSLVPKGYEMGMIPVNEVSCNRCHSETGRRLGEFEFDIILYGEIWGEEKIFTWHLFEPHRYIYGPWDDTDGSRKLNPRMVQANLVKEGKPSETDPDYRPLPSVFKPEPSRKERTQR